MYRHPIGHLIAGALIALASAASLEAQAQIQLPEKTRQQIAELLADKESRTPAQRKVSSRLLYAAKTARGVPLTPHLAALPRIMSTLKTRGASVQVDMYGAVTAALLKAIGDLGGQVESALPEYNSIRAWIPLTAVERLAERDDVWSIKDPAPVATASQLSGGSKADPGRRAAVAAALRRRMTLASPRGRLFSPLPPSPPPTLTIIDTGGVLAHGVNLVTANGTGVKVAAMSDGVKSVPSMVAGNLLPPVTIVPGQAGGANNDEGTAELQNIANIAPGASLYFAAGDVSTTQFAANIYTLVDTYHVDIIVDDIELTDDPVFQDGVIAQAVNYAYSQGVMYFAHAQNDNNVDSGTSGTWEGDYVGSGDHISLPAPINKSYEYHLFPTGQEYLLLGNQVGDPSLAPMWVFLQWSDTWNYSSNDYDLLLTDGSGNLVDASTNLQTGSYYSEPVELLPWSGDTNLPAAGELIWIVKTTSAAARALHINTGRGTLFEQTHTINVGTTGAGFGHGAATGAMSVGAANVASTAAGAQGGGGIFTGGAANPVEIFSADGPRRIFYDQNGNPLTAGTPTFGSGAGVLRAKPDIVAADGAQNSVVGFGPYFYGTSASAPHAAGVGALLKSVDPYLTPNGAYTALRNSALLVTANPTQPNGVGARTQGAGIIMANLAVPLVTPTITIQTSPISQPFSVSGAGCVTGAFTGSTSNIMYTDATCTLTLTNTTIPGGAGSRYVFRNWSDASTASSRSLTVPVGPATFTANYVAQYLLTTSPSPGAGGSINISPSSTDGYYDSGTSVQLTPVPAGGYSFSAWSGDITGGANPQSVVMSGPRSITATFVATATAPVLGIASAHSGNFYQGQAGATYTITVHSSSGATPTSGALTVSEVLPAGLTLVSMAGTGWTCPAGANTCTRSDALPAGASYPPITVTVNVSVAAPTLLVNSVNVAGGGAPAAAATDSTAILFSPVLNISKTHSGGFTQGQNGATYNITVWNAATWAATSGVVTVTETAPSGLTLVSMSGTGWTCPAGGNTCTTSNVLAAGAGYPAIAVTVNVTSSATSPQVNSAGVAGGGSAPAIANDSTTINTTALATASVLEGPAAGSDQVLLSVGSASGNWTAQSNNSWLHIAGGSAGGTGSAVVQFTFDVNAGAVRNGTLTIAGQTLTVTQAGAGYVAGSAVATLVSGLNNAGNIALDSSGNIYIADTNNNAVKVWNATTKTVSTLISSGLSYPAAVALDPQGNVYIADGSNAIIMWNATSRVLSTLVSTGLNTPNGLAVDTQGNVYIADTNNNAVKLWNATTHLVSTLVSGLSSPTSVALDYRGNLYIADYGNSAIKVWDANTHAVSTLVSSGIESPPAVTVDVHGNLFIDDYNWAIKRWNAATGTLTTLISSGIQTCWGIAVDANGYVYISDTYNNAVKADYLGYLLLGAIGRNETSASGSDSISVQVLPAGLPVAASSDQSWLTITGTGGGAIAFSYTANSGSARTAHISVLGQTITVTQAAASGPVLAVTKTHVGNFTQGQNGAAYSVAVSNTTGAGPASGTVTVNENVPAGMTLVSMSGTGWTCATNSCTRSDALAGGAIYPVITVTVNVAANATSPQVNSVSVSGGGSATANATDPTVITATGSQALRFVPVTPCRIADTRLAAGPFGGPSITGGGSRDFTIPNSACSIPASAQAYSLNVAVVPATTLGYLTLYPAGQSRPLASTLNSLDGRIKSNAAIVPAGTGGAVSVFASDTTNVILDINGYFIPASDPTGLAFYPITPCRIGDTRTATAPLGGPALVGGQNRTLPILASTCNLPATAKAYSLNFAAVPGGSSLGYLTAWPTGQSRPVAASLNALTGAITANAAIVPAGTNGSIDVFASNTSNLVIDINGYFAPMGTGGLSLYGVTPCRVLDTRQPSGSPAITSRDVAVSASACGIPASAQAHVMSVTVVPQGTPAYLGYLTLWPQGQTRPVVSTLNALDGAITSNLAIVPTTNGSISAFASNATHLILDISGYFAQ